MRIDKMTFSDKTVSTVRKLGHPLRCSFWLKSLVWASLTLIEKGRIMALAMLRAPPSDLEVRLSEHYKSPTALHGHHPMFSRYYQWIKGHLQTVDFGYTEIASDKDFTVISPYVVQLDCVNAESFMFSEEVHVALSALYDGGREVLEGKVSVPWGFSFRELYPTIVAGLLSGSRALQDAFADAEVFGDTNAAEAVAQSIFILDCEVLRGQPVAFHS